MGQEDWPQSHDRFICSDFAKLRHNRVAKHIVAVEATILWEAWHTCSCFLPLLAGISMEKFHPRAQGSISNVLQNISKWICAVCTHAEVVCISCQLLLKFCFSSFIKLMPSFCLISIRCFSLAASTCRKVEISSSSWEKQREEKGESC